MEPPGAEPQFRALQRRTAGNQLPLKRRHATAPECTPAVTSASAASTSSQPSRSLAVHDGGLPTLGLVDVAAPDAPSTRRVEEGRLAGTYRQPAVSLPRSSNWTCPFRTSSFSTGFTAAHTRAVHTTWCRATAPRITPFALRHSGIERSSVAPPTSSIG